MRKHSGMRPQDIVVLIKIIAQRGKNWLNKDLAKELHISQSEISDSLNRSSMAGLIDHEKRRVYKTSLLEFIEYGLHYVFPVSPGGMVNGIYTAHSHPFMREHFNSELHYVWPDHKGEVRGLSIDPLYKEVVKAAGEDELLYKMLALVDVVRVGKVRERNVAVSELKNSILNES